MRSRKFIPRQFGKKELLPPPEFQLPPPEFQLGKRVTTTALNTTPLINLKPNPKNYKMKARVTQRFFTNALLLVFSMGLLVSTSAQKPLRDTNNLSNLKSDYQPTQSAVKGQVTDAKDGQPLSGVTVTNGSSTTTTDNEGYYALNVKNANATLVFTYAGFASQEVSLNSRTTLDIKLVAANNVLDEVVVIGYGSVKRRDLTGSVTTVKPDEINRSPAVTVSNLLQGQVAGVQVSSPSGAPGANTSIRIRGQNSINGGNEPLYVIDGVIINNDNENKLRNLTSNGFAERIGISTLASINPADIETMEVLKDASATAIYGTRGSNGVILITTKRGKAGTSTVDFSIETGVQRIAKPYELLNAEQFIALNTEARANSLPAAAPASLSTAYNSDWQKEVLRDAPVSNYQLSVRGGAQKTTYNLSANYFDQKGIARGNDLKRYSIRLNLDNQATKWLKIGTSTSLTRQTSHLFNTFSNVLNLVPNQPLYSDNTGLYGFNSDEIDLGLNLGFSGAGITPNSRSPLYDINLATNQLNQNRILSSNYGEISFLKHFKLRTALSLDVIDTRDQSYRPKRGSLSQSTAFTGYGNAFDYLIDNTLSYNNEIGDHTINAFIGQSAQKHQDDYLSTRGQNLNDNTGFYSYEGNNLAEQIAIPAAEIWTLASYLGRVNYAYKHRYLATVSMRRDGSSRFGAGKKYANFPSASLAWVVSEESFMKKWDMISQLKIRVGYGVTGNQDIGLYRSLSIIGITKSVLNNAPAVGRQPSNSPNPDLTWEETSQTNIGIDLGFLNNRFSLTADVYRKFTDKLLYDLPLQLTTGFTSITSNVGSVINKGWELALTSRNIATKDFNWSSNFNISRNYNEVHKLGGPTVISGNTLLKEGEPINAWYGFIAEGIFQKGDDFTFQPNATVGERRYKKIDPNSTTVINSSEDRVILGNPTPELTYGFTNNLNWRNIDLSFFLQGVQGRDIFNSTRQSLESVSGRGNNLVTVLNRWTPTNTSGTLPIARQTGSKNTYASGLSSYYIEDGSYLKLRNITLGYTLPKTILNKLGASNFRLYGSISNVFTITKYTGQDPDVSSTDDYPYPLARTFSFGLSTQF